MILTTENDLFIFLDESGTGSPVSCNHVTNKPVVCCSRNSYQQYGEFYTNTLKYEQTRSSNKHCDDALTRFYHVEKVEDESKTATEKSFLLDSPYHNVMISC